MIPVKEALRSFEATLDDRREGFRWRRLHDPAYNKGTQAFIAGRAGPWLQAMVISWLRDNGDRGYDGTATHGEDGLVLRLTPELAKKAHETAWEQLYWLTPPRE